MKNYKLRLLTLNGPNLQDISNDLGEFVRPSSKTSNRMKPMNGMLTHNEKLPDVTDFPVLCRTSAEQRTVYFRAVQELRNSLDPPLNLKPTLKDFKRCLKKK